MTKYGIHGTVIHQFCNKFGDGSYGRITLSRRNLINIGGYDESFGPMGYQDKDLLIRLMISGIIYIHLGNRRYNRAILNSKKESLINTPSGISWEEMNLRNYFLSRQNITSGRIIANMDKQHIGITRNIYGLE
jgi:hypothetical protein